NLTHLPESESAQCGCLPLRRPRWTFPPKRPRRTAWSDCRSPCRTCPCLKTSEHPSTHTQSRSLTGVAKPGQKNGRPVNDVRNLLPPVASHGSVGLAAAIVGVAHHLQVLGEVQVGNGLPLVHRAPVNQRGDARRQCEHSKSLRERGWDETGGEREERTKA